MRDLSVVGVQGHVMAGEELLDSSSKITGDICSVSCAVRPRSLSIVLKLVLIIICCSEENSSESICS